MRGIRFVICLVFGLSVALVSCESLTTNEPSIDPGIVAALAPACSGQGIPGAGSVNTSGAVANHLVLLSHSGTPFELSSWLPQAWAPTSVADAELVACVQIAPQRNVVEVCPYVGSDVTRYEVTREFKVVEAVSGSTISSFEIIAQPRACRLTEDASLTSIEGVIGADLVTAHLSGLVQLGRFVDPDPDGTLAPDWTPGTEGTPKPGHTTLPTASGMAKELREALDEGLVSVNGTGDGLQSLDLELTSKVDVDLDVTIEAGTLLEPRVRGTQTMVVTTQQVISVRGHESVTATLDVACVEMHQDQPTGDDKFHVLNDQPANDLLLLLATPEFGNATGRVQQFAVWTITNNPKRNAYVGLTSGFDIFGSGPDDEEIAAIRDLFDAAGIDTGHYRALR